MPLGAHAIAPGSGGTRAALSLPCAEKGRSGVCTARAEALAVAPRRWVYGVGGAGNTKVRGRGRELKSQFPALVEVLWQANTVVVAVVRGHPSTHAPMFAGITSLQG